LYANDRLDEHFVILLLASTIPSNHTIIKNFSDPTVSKMLNRVSTDVKTSNNLRKWVKKILDGESWDEIKNQ
jgi:hypothetical protein